MHGMLDLATCELFYRMFEVSHNELVDPLPECLKRRRFKLRYQRQRSVHLEDEPSFVDSNGSGNTSPTTSSQGPGAFPFSSRHSSDDTHAVTAV